MSAVAIITARGGSKRIPRKNIRLFLGRPIIAYSIEVALSSQLFEEVMVSTDDEEIAEVARDHGAAVPFLRSWLTSNDLATTADVIEEVLATYADADVKRSFHHACCIYPTAPLLTVEGLAQGFDRLKVGPWDYVLSAGRFSSPVQRAFGRGIDGSIHMIFPEHEETRSQDLPPIYHDAAQFYWGSAQAWLERRQMFGHRTTFVELPLWRVQDIDTLDDWTMAERLFTLLRCEGQ